MKRNWKTVTVLAVVVVLTAVVGALCQSAAAPPERAPSQTPVSSPYELLVTPNAQWLMKFKHVEIEDTITCFNLKLIQAKMAEQQQAISQLRAQVVSLQNQLADFEGPRGPSSIDEQRDGLGTEPVLRDGPVDRPEHRPVQEGQP